MKFACDSCQTKYTIPDEKVRGKVLKIRCKKCGSVITVKEEVAAPPEPEAPPVEERTRVADIGLLEQLRNAERARESATAPQVAVAAAPEPAPGVEWFAMVNGEQVGPLSPDDMQAKVASGEVTDRSHVWRDGLADWKRAGDVGELASLFAPKPAPAPAPPPARPASAPKMIAPMPAPAAASPLANFRDDDNVPTVARPRPNLNELFGDVHEPAAPAPAAVANAPIGDDDESTNANGLANGHADPVPAPSSNLADLMGDIDTSDHVPTGVRPVEIGSGSGDPFSSVPDAPSMAAPQIGEQTRFFMKKAGVTNRNPWWKYAIFVVVVLAAPVAVFYALGSMGVGGTVVVIDQATGQEKVVAKYSLDNLKSNGLAALLSGEAHQPVAHPKPQPKKQVAAKDEKKAAPVPDLNAPKANLSDADKAKLQQGLGLVSGDPSSNPTSSGPKERKENKGPQNDQGAAGLSEEVVAKVVAENAPSFNKCVEDKLKRDPSWRGGKINLTVKIGPSGTVIDSSIAESKVASDDVGDCIKGRVKRMKFPRFDGDEPQEVQFPLLLANGG